MGRLKKDLDAIDHLFKPNRGNILLRCEEILQAAYGTVSPSEVALPSNPKRIAGIGRIVRRMRLGASARTTVVPGIARKGVLSNISPALLSSFAKHAQRCCTPVRPKCCDCPLVSFCPSGIRRAAAPRGKPIAIDLFAGAGGLSSGFRREGFHLVLAVERDKNAAQSYRVNNPGVPVLEADVRKVRATHVLSALGLRRGQIAAVIAGPPCQGFSAAGPRKPRARRNFLFQSIANIAKGLKARAVIMENVPGLRQVRGVRFENRILARFAASGYKGKVIDVDASAFGVPQRRRRLIFICARRGYDLSSFKLRPLRNLRRTTVRLALRGLPRPSVGGDKRAPRLRGKTLHNHRAMSHSTRVVRRIKEIKPGEGPISYRRLRSDLARTLIAGHRAMPVHPRQDRTITVREAARLQTVPDKFRFLGPHAEQPLQVANVVPYLLARVVARAVSVELKRNAPRQD